MGERWARALAAMLGAWAVGAGAEAAEGPQDLRTFTVQAPLDYRAPAGRTVTLRYAVAPATDPHAAAAPIFVIEPLAESGVDTAPRGLLQTLAALRRDHDLVFVDQRGVGGEGVLACPAADATLGAYSPARLAVCAPRLDPGVLRSLNSGTFANDLETVRRRLGTPRILLIGYFYGARIGLDYLGRWPGRVIAAAFTDVAPTGSSGSVEGARSSDAAVAATLAACRAQPACQARYPALAADYDRVRRRLDTAQFSVAPAGDGRPGVLDGRSVLRWLVGQTFRWRSAADWPRLVHDLAEGRDEAVVAAYLRDRGALRADYPIAERLTVECAEDAGLLRPAALAVAGTTGAVIAASGDGAGPEAEACRTWPHSRYRSPPPRRAHTPILAIVGADNIAGPPADVRRSLAPWPRARLVVLPGRSRAADNDWDACVGPLVTAFLTTPGRSLDTGCAASLRRPEFRALAAPAQG